MLKYLFFVFVPVVISCNKDVSPYVPESNNGSFRYLALGDSYTKGESVVSNVSFPYQLLYGLIADTVIPSGMVKAIAETGWTTTDLKNAIAADSDTNKYDLVTLLIGVNNQYKNFPISIYTPDFTELLNQAIKMAGGDTNKVIVLSIPDYGYTPDGKDDQQHISSEIDSYNVINKDIATKAGVTYVNVTDISRQGLNMPTLVAGDGLHPSAFMYSLWVNLLVQEVKKKI